MLSDRGRQIFEERGIDERLLENNVYLFELLLQLEQFMKQKSIPSEYMLDENLLGRAMDNVLYHIEGTIGREEKSMGNNLIKNHLLLHTPQYASRWGPFTGMDSGDNERHHKTEVKPQAKWTQRREYNFLGQFGNRWNETRLVDKAWSHLRQTHPSLFPQSKMTKGDDGASIVLDGSCYSVGVDTTGVPAMSWDDKYSTQKSTIPTPVLEFLCHSLLHKIQGHKIRCRTEAKIVLDGKRLIFRCHPNFRSDSNLRVHMWYDWATFRYETPAKSEERPGQIVAIVDLGRFKTNGLDEEGELRIRQRIVKANHPHAVVRLFSQVPKFFRKSCLGKGKYNYSVKWGRVMDGFYLLPLSSIVGPAIVVPNIPADPDCKVKCPGPLDGGYFLLPSRKQLAEDFYEMIKELTPKAGDEEDDDDEEEDDDDDDDDEDDEDDELEEDDDDDDDDDDDEDDEDEEDDEEEDDEEEEDEEDNDEDEESSAEESATNARVNYISFYMNNMSNST